MSIPLKNASAPRAGLSVLISIGNRILWNMRTSFSNAVIVYAWSHHHPTIR